MTIQASPSDQLIFAPVGIAHLTADNADLVRAAAAGRSRIRVTTAAQLNGVPHLGTVVTMLTVFAFTRHVADALGRPADIIFDALENAPAEQITIDGDTYTRNVGDLIDTGQLERAERTSGFERLLAWASDKSGIPYEFRPYAVYQGLRPVRECLHIIASRQDDFAPIVAPRDGIIRIRPRCPECRLMQKSAADLTITALSGAVRLGSRCPRHGRYTETVHIDGGGWYDANTPSAPSRRATSSPPSATPTTRAACPSTARTGAAPGTPASWHPRSPSSASLPENGPSPSSHRSSPTTPAASSPRPSTLPAAPTPTCPRPSLISTSFLPITANGSSMPSGPRSPAGPRNPVASIGATPSTTSPICSARSWLPGSSAPPDVQENR